MKARCKNARVASHGGRGITYESRWESFDSFLADMGERPPGASLDRINVFGNYCKENCRWADALTQANNKRATRYRRYDWMVGERVGGAYGSTAEWARYLKRLTGNAKWTSRKLNAVLEVIPSINDLVGAVSPSFGFAPEEFSIRSGTEFRHIWGDYLKAVYLSAA